MMPRMPNPDWNEHYASGNMPWDSGEPEPYLVELVENGTIVPGRALEVGCGTGNDALWLAARGFEVLGVDISPLAVERAQARARAAGTQIEFRVLDFFSARIDRAPFDFVFDRGVLHVFDDAESRARFARQVALALAPGGRWLSLAGSTEGPKRDHGPPRRTARELVEAVEPELELLELCSARFEVGEGVKAWRLLARAREIPAQPSTNRA